MGDQQPASHPAEHAKHEPAEPAPAKAQAASPGASRVRKYKLLMVIPLLLILGSLGVLVSQYATTGEWVQRSIELKGGTVITLAGTADAAAAEAALPGANARTLRGFSGSSLLIELGPEADAQASLAALAAAGLPTATSSVQTIGPSLGASFWQQTLIGLVAAFALMGIVVFFLFKNPVTSGYVILSVVADIVVTLAAMQLLGIELTLAGLAALLLHHRLLRGHGHPAHQQAHEARGRARGEPQRRVPHRHHHERRHPGRARGAPALRSERSALDHRHRPVHRHPRGHPQHLGDQRRAPGLVPAPEGGLVTC